MKFLIFKNLIIRNLELTELDLIAFLCFGFYTLIMPSARKVFLSALILLTVMSARAAKLFADETPFSSLVAKSVLVESPNVSDGNIVSVYDGKYYLSNKEYDGEIVGVVNKNAAIVFDHTDNTGEVPIVASGEVYVLVSTINGPIKAGDAITSSSTSGIGMKAIKSGLVIGQALEAYSDTNASKAILVNLNIHYFSGSSFFADLESNLLSLVKGGTLAATDAPSKFLKYLFATTVAVLSVILGLLNFGKTARSGVEAIGRNPLAKNAITAGIVMNIGITAAVTVVGLLIAYFILRL